MKTARYWILWHGGYSYSCPDSADLEPATSWRDVYDILNGRRDNRDGSTPCVEADSAWVFYGPDKPQDTGDLYPDWIIERGPHGGLVRQRA